MRGTHAIGDGRVTLVPPPPLGRVWIRVHPVENAHHGFRLLPRPHRAHVDDAVGRPRAIHRRRCGLDDFNLPHVFHGQVRPPDLAQIARKQGQPIEQHLDAAAHPVAVPTATTDADLPVEDGDARGFGHQPLQIECIGRFCQIRLQHRNRHRFLLHGRPGDARRHHHCIQRFRLRRQHHASTHAGNPLARQGDGFVAHKTEGGPTRILTRHPGTRVLDAAIDIRREHLQPRLLHSPLDCHPGNGWPVAFAPSSVVQCVTSCAQLAAPASQNIMASARKGLCTCLVMRQDAEDQDEPNLFLHQTSPRARPFLSHLAS